MEKILCFGEPLLRFSPAPGSWLSAASMPVYLGGAELNTARALQHWGCKTAYFSALPENYLGDEILQYLENCGIDMQAIERNSGRMGGYYLAQGSDLKSAGVIYDREYSAFSMMKAGKRDWSAIFHGIQWFHLSAICPAINSSVAELCLEAVSAARERGIRVSIDLNYRARLWKDRNPVDSMIPLMENVDLVMGNIWAADKLLGITLDEEEISGNYREAAQKSCVLLTEKFPQVRQIAYTFRLDQPVGLNYFACFYEDKTMIRSEAFCLDSVVDRVGSGDCFMAGLIYGLLKKLSPSAVLEFAVLAALSKMQVKGDSINLSPETIQKNREKFGRWTNFL